LAAAGRVSASDRPRAWHRRSLIDCNEADINYRGMLYSKVQASIFYALLRTTSKSAWNIGSADWIVLGIMSFAMALAVLTIACIVSIFFQHRVFLPAAKTPFVTLWGSVGIGLLIFNYYSLVFEGKWSRFKGEFQHLSEATRTIGSIVVWVSVILIVLAAQWAATIAFKLPNK